MVTVKTIILTHGKNDYGNGKIDSGNGNDLKQLNDWTDMIYLICLRFTGSAWSQGDAIRWEQFWWRCRLGLESVNMAFKGKDLIYWKANILRF